MSPPTSMTVSYAEQKGRFCENQDDLPRIYGATAQHTTVNQMSLPEALVQSSTKWKEGNL